MSDRPKLDKEEFRAWRDSPATRWVMERLEAESLELAQRVGEGLFNSPLRPLEQWQADQVQVAYSKGYFDGLLKAVAGEYEALLTDEELQALKEAEEKAKE